MEIIKMEIIIIVKYFVNHFNKLQIYVIKKYIL
jgi:hypothetical protein